MAITDIERESVDNLEHPSLPAHLVKTAKKGWQKQGWTPKAGLNRHRLFVTKTSTHSNDYQTILTQPLYGDPTGASTQAERSKLM